MERLRFEAVSFAYKLAHGRHPVVALDGVSLSVNAGEIVMIYGPTGAGKSSLLNLAARLRVPDKGRVLFKGEDLALLRVGAIADYRKRRVGYARQSFWMGDAPAWEYAAMKLMGTGIAWKQAEKLVKPIMEELGLNEAKQNRKASDLSMGERQRVAIARALTNEPELLLADEPTSNLDSRTGDEVVSLLLDRCHNGLAIVMVTHNKELAKIGDHSYELRDGHLGPYDPDVLSVDALASE